MSSMEISMSCKFCLDELDVDDVENHGCFLGRIDDVRADENGVLFLLDSSNNEAELSVPTSNTDSPKNFDELLITEVQKYPALYDHRIPIEQRSRAKRDSCWRKIYVNLQDLQKKWKNERDKYIKAKKEDQKYVPSGSAAQIKKPPAYRNYALMRFLDDIIKNKDTTCNVQLPPLSDQTMEHSNPYDSSNPASCSPSSSVCSASSLIANKSKIKKRRRASSDIEEALLGAIRQPIQMPPPPVPLELTPPPTPPIHVTEIESFCRRLAASLQRLDQINPSVRVEAEIELLRVLFQWEYGTKQKTN
ncbi:uncharacterized protein LOC125501875 [Athalia rosae]|uniref:uncharacterized protein LOC125501875 n=1 Tax=Athalia rosae TaxID=37344 RepID=UPI00203399F0|nr:uncharacterized protein LOC125501875 [Athalia rosae]